MICKIKYFNDYFYKENVFVCRTWRQLKRKIKKEKGKFNTYKMEILAHSG